MKIIMLCVVCLGQTWAQLGPAPENYAPPLPINSVEKATVNKPSGYTVSLDVTAPTAIQDSLSSALLLELRKRPDVVITGTSVPDYRWSLVCVTTAADLLVCSSVGLQNLDLAEIERYFPELAKYGMWWVLRYLTENDPGGGFISYHGVLTGNITDKAPALAGFAMRAVASFEANTIERARKSRADALKK